MPQRMSCNQKAACERKGMMLLGSGDLRGLRLTVAKDHHCALCRSDGAAYTTPVRQFKFQRYRISVKLQTQQVSKNLHLVLHKLYLLPVAGCHS